ncbi:hypothetical protein BDY24DRAFT_395032 [Mrakia frigida]|uniref:uncharacterized protein n=1 Tax=Mrakia frigida TaxID=29902 RepID=UPI003FCC0DCF
MLTQYKALVSQLPIQFTKAKESGHLISYPSTTEIVNDNGLDFEIRVCPALEAKRSAANESDSSSVNEDGKPVPQGKRQRASDPFEGPYEGNDLYLGKVAQEDEPDGGEKMVGLLNRFSVVDHHFLLVSEDFQSQSSPLHPPHLLHAYLTLMALKNAGKEFVAIYNCGEKSGASQKRRHIQFIPVDDEPLVDQWTSGAILARPDLPFVLPYLPFSHAFARLPPTLSARSSKDPSVIAMALLSAHIALLDSIHAAIWSQSDSSSTKATPGEPLSYNVILTLQHMVLVPRFKEKSDLVSLKEAGGLSLNSLAFAGMVLTSGEREKEEVKSLGVLEVLKSVAYEVVESKESVEERSMDEGSMAE